MERRHSFRFFSADLHQKHSPVEIKHYSVPFPLDYNCFVHGEHTQWKKTADVSQIPPVFGVHWNFAIPHEQHQNPETYCTASESIPVTLQSVSQEEEKKKGYRLKVLMRSYYQQ